VEGWTASQVDTLQEAITRGDVMISLRCKDGDKIKRGCNHAQLETTKQKFKIAALCTREIQLIVHIKGFPKRTDLPSDEESETLKFASKHNMAQFVHTCHVIPRSAVPVKVEVKTEIKQDTSDEAYSMEEWINAKDFHKIVSIKLTSRGETLNWNDNLALH
jgi:hypothetical protein